MKITQREVGDVVILAVDHAQDLFGGYVLWFGKQYFTDTNSLMGRANATCTQARDDFHAIGAKWIWRRIHGGIITSI